MQKKVLFLYNGGTIGQIHEKRGNQEILVPPKDGMQFQEVCNPILKKFAEKILKENHVIKTILEKKGKIHGRLYRRYA